MIATHPRIYNPPTSAARKLEQIGDWLESPSLLLLAEGDWHRATLRELASKARIAGPVIHEARIVALCLQHGVPKPWSPSRDFGRFSKLRAVNPLTAH